MKVEKMEVLAVNVKNLNEAIKLFSDILGVTFVKFPEDLKIEETTTDHASPAAEGIKHKIAMDRAGFMGLIESDPPTEKEGLRSIQFKVANLERAKAEMKQKGIRRIADIKVGGLKEAIFSSDDLHGIQLCLVEYETPTLVDAILQK